ncbi:MAG: FAD-dependent oxidoreductase, partial [Phycisphaerales bacterium]
FVRDIIDEHSLECELVGDRLDPYRLVLALGQLCARRGIMVFERSRVRQVVATQPILLVGDGFQVEADRVVLGTNAYAPKLGFFRRELLPIHHGCVVTERLGAVFDSLPPTFTQPIGNGADYYWGRKLPDRRLLFGGGLRYSYDNGLSFPGAEHLYAALTRGMRGMFPRLGDTRIEYQWNGPLGMFADSQPRLGTTGDHANVYYALGYAGIGIAMAIRFGSLISGMLDGIPPPAWTRTPAAWLPGEPFRYMFVNAGLHLVDFGMLRV